MTPPRNAVQPALRADVSSRRRESGVFLSPAIFFDSYGHAVVPLLGGLAIRDINAEETQTIGYFSPKQHDGGGYVIQSSYSFVDENNRLVCPTSNNHVLMLKATDEEGNVLNNVVHLVTRFSDDPRQNIDMVKLLETTLTINPDCIAVAEMKGGESMQAINAANTGHSVITTIHANSCEDTYYRMVTLCKQEQPGMDDATLQNLATKAFPIVAFAKRLEDNSRRIMEITECETLQDGRKKMRTLYRFNITDNIIVEGKPKIIGHYEKVENLSEGLQKRLRENGLPLKMQEQLLAKR